MSWGCSSGIADAHRDDRQRFVVRAGEKLTAFLELESVDREILRNFDLVRSCSYSDRYSLHPGANVVAINDQRQAVGMPGNQVM